MGKYNIWQVFFKNVIIISMKKQIKRWYEKDEYLKAFMSLLEQIPVEEQCEIAVDIILQASSYIDRDYSKMVSDIGNFDPKDFKRWYDKNPNLHTAIESLRDLSESQREEIIKGFSSRILKTLNYKLEGLDE